LAVRRFQRAVRTTDILRGLAWFGVLIVNILPDFRDRSIVTDPFKPAVLLVYTTLWRSV